MSDKIWFDPTSDKWALSDGEHYLEVPHWAREIIVNEFERETRQLKTENAKLRDGAYAMRQLYEDELKHALGENAKLRERAGGGRVSERLDERLRRAARTYRRLGNHTAEGMFLEAADTICELQTENAKLRELVCIAGTYCVNGLCGKDDGCPLYLDKPYCALHDRMRELGVEVDDGQQ